MKKIVCFGLLAACVVLIATLTALHASGPSITGTIQQDNNPCSLEYPIAVTVKNFTFSTIHRGSFKMEAWRDQRSVNLLSRSISRYRFNKVVEPFQTETVCFSDENFKLPSPKISPSKTNPTTHSTGNFAETIKGWHEFTKLIRGVEIRTYDFKPENLD